MNAITDNDPTVPLQPELNTSFGRIVELAPNLIYVFNHERQANEYSNRSLGESLGYSVEEIRDMGANLMPSLIHPDDLPKVFAHFARIQLLRDSQVASLQYRVKHSDGHWIWLLSNDTVFRRSELGEVTHHIGAASDITAQKSAESALQTSETKAKAANEELKDFSYAISHDMKAPSNTLKLILGELEDVLRTDTHPDAAELLGLAHATIDRMQFLIDDVLHYTRVVGEDITFEIVDLNDVMRAVKTMLKADIKMRQATLQIDPLPQVWGAKSQLIILFQNLVQNGLKFARDGVAPVVEIRATLDRSRNQVCVSVVDNGIGISPARKDQIFHLFKRLNSAERYAGSGIGLATCRRIALNHKTEISLASEQDQGSSFSIELDIA